MTPWWLVVLIVAVAFALPVSLLFLTSRFEDDIAAALNEWEDET